MKIKQLILTLILSIILFTSCDKIDPYDSKKGGSVIEPTDTTKNYSNLLLIEFTGYKCGYCPPAAELAYQFHNETNGKVIVMAIHEGNFATPKPKNVDFQTSEGQTIHNLLSVSSYPSGCINYKVFNESKIFEFTRPALEPTINKIIQEENPFKIILDTIRDNTTKAKVTVELVKAGNYNHKIGLYIVEDSIIAFQLDYRIVENGSWVEFYPHKGVFRKSVSSILGDNAISGNLTKGTKIEKEFNLSFDPKWNKKHLRYIAFVANQNNEIEQVIELKQGK